MCLTFYEIPLSIINANFDSVLKLTLVGSSLFNTDILHIVVQLSERANI